MLPGLRYFVIASEETKQELIILEDKDNKDKAKEEKWENKSGRNEGSKRGRRTQTFGQRIMKKNKRNGNIMQSWNEREMQNIFNPICCVQGSNQLNQLPMLCSAKENIY